MRGNDELAETQPAVAGGDLGVQKHRQPGRGEPCLRTGREVSILKAAAAQAYVL